MNLSGMISNLVNTAPFSSNHNSTQAYEVVYSPDDTVTCMAFSPASITQANYLIAGSWDNNVRCWEIQSTGNSIPKQQQTMTASVMDVAWSNVIPLPSSITIILTINYNLNGFICRMGAKCSWLDVTKWSNAGIYLPTNAFRYYECFLITFLSI